ncbi:guanine-1-methyltransferase-domain-containing protein [Pilobolus umbonatus]|nr:guanine-1-methyltransferase-domain-containing protein [Pilobolus umbonatus]
MSSTLRQYHGITYDLTDPKFQGLSKRHLKKLLRDELWDQTKDERKLSMRQKEKEKRKDRKMKVREGVLEAKPTRKKLAALSELTKISTVVDCGFTEYMTERELVSLASQLGYAYGKNRKAPKSMTLYLSSFDDSLKKIFNEKVETWTYWDTNTCKILESSYLDVFDKDTLVYLSADSDHVLESLEEDKVYIIGGIVDKNRHKGLCQKKATDQGISTARLPIGDYIKMSSRKVLTVNQVCEIMLKWLEYNDWEKAFMDVIPGRKLKETAA